jgi:hypothetical protein
MIAGSSGQIATESARDHERHPDCSAEVSFPAPEPAMIAAKNEPINDRGQKWALSAANWPRSCEWTWAM